MWHPPLACLPASNALQATAEGKGWQGIDASRLFICICQGQIICPQDGLAVFRNVGDVRLVLLSTSFEIQQCFLRLSDDSLVVLANLIVHSGARA